MKNFKELRKNQIIKNNFGESEGIIELTHPKKWEIPKKQKFLKKRFKNSKESQKN